jgi:pimeloyl-ACP methyl ester carboxylesterase
MSTFKIGNIELTGTRKGSGSPILLLHGANGPASNGPLAERLAKNHTVLAPVHPGFADCPDAADLDTVDDLAYLYLDLLEQEKLNDVTVIGHSMGGWIAAEIAVKTTARIARLVLIDAVGVRFGGPTDVEIADLFAMLPADRAKIAYHDPKYIMDPSKLTDADKLAMQRSAQATARYAWEPYLHNPKLKQRLRRIDKPTLVVWGNQDRIVGPEYGKKYAAAIPGARFVSFDNCGHVPQVEQAEKFDALLGEFIQGRKVAAE